MATLAAVVDGYVMVFMLYLVNNSLLLFSVREYLRLPWWSVLLLTLVESIAIYQILHYLWMGNILVAFLFFLLCTRVTAVPAYKLMYLNMVTVAYTTLCNLLFYIIWGPSYTWYWPEVCWMLVGYAATAPFVGMFIHRALWPRLSRLALPSARTLWIVPAFTIIITMLVGSAHIQHLMTGYELVYGMTSMLVVIFAAGVCLLTLVILQKNQTEANQKHDMEIVKVQIASQSRCYLEVMERMDEIRIMRHDLRHHTRVASMLLEEGNLEALRAFLGDAAGDRRLHDNIVYSHNHISDLVAHHSMKMAEAEDIQLSIRCGLPKSFWVSDADLCILLGNLMDNALNACRLQPSGARTISLTTAIRGEEAYIYMENSCGDAKLDTSAYRKKAGITQSGGYGISSVRNVAEKYNGAASFERQEGCFKSAVLLCHPIKTMDAATQERSGRPERMVSTTN